MTQPPISGSPPASVPRDDLDRPVTQRQLLHAVDVLRRTLRELRQREREEIWRSPDMRLEHALEVTWEQLTVELRQEARAEALTQVGNHTDQGTE